MEYVKKKMDWILPEPYCIKSPNYSSGIIPECIIIHYNAAPSKAKDPCNFDRIYKWVTQKNTKSVHFCVFKDGTIWQTVPLNKKSWHAGDSAYTFDGKKRTGINSYGFGVELDNVGPLTEKDGKYYDCYGGEYHGRVVKVGKKYWEPYTFEQVFAAKSLIKYLCMIYNLDQDRILGHCDVSPGRKIDPGEQFPWALFHESNSEQKNEALKMLIPYEENK